MFSYFLTASIVLSKLVSGYIVVLSGTENVIQNGTAHFKAEVFDDEGSLSTSYFIFHWSDNASPSHSYEIGIESPAYWNVTYGLEYPPADYEITVKVQKSIIGIRTTVDTKSMKIKVTKYLVGDILLSQGNFTRRKYVSNEMPVNHTISLKDNYVNYIQTKNFIRVFWFVDCIYYGPKFNFEFDFNYTKTDKMHFVEAMLIASSVPNLIKNKDEYSIEDKFVQNNKTNLIGHSNVTSSNNLNASKENISIIEEGIDEELKIWLKNYNLSVSKSKPYGYCINSSIVPQISKYTYGFFRTNLTVKAPVKISPINGTNWLMDGEILNINVSCNGSSPYAFCVLLKAGLYNITGNETCNDETVIRNCSFGIQHLFKKPSEYTLVVIISNAVSRVVKPIAVNIYKVKKHAQLSVIIVPVSFSLIATILIIFGVAYYVQSKHKYTIEVADFDFGNQTSNMEYKSFRERLRESISNSFLKSNDYLDNDSSWSDSKPTSRKYGSMQ